MQESPIDSAKKKAKEEEQALINKNSTLKKIRDAQ